MWLRGAKFRKLGRPQCRSFGETFQTRYRLSVPSMPTPEEFMAAAGPVFTGKTVSNDGPQCREFERELADYLGAPVMTTPSGDLGLMVAFATLRSVQLQDGHSGRNQVIVPSYTHPSTVNALLWNQFEPVFCDIELETLCTSAAHVRPHLRAETAAICPVHAHGNPCDMAPLADLAREHGVALISDASAALSAELDGTPVGAAGDMEVFSFSGTKVLTCGEGGAICFGNERYRQAARIIGRYGVRENYRALEKGINAKLAELPAALGRVNLQRLPQAMRARRQAAARYRQYLQGLEGVQVQQTCTDLALSSCKDFALVFEETSMASRVAASLNSCRVDTRPYYRPLHQMPAFCRYVREPLPHTDHVGNNVLCIPIYNDIHPELVDMIAGIVKDSLRMKSVFGLSTDGRELLRRRPDSSEPYGIGLS